MGKKKEMTNCKNCNKAIFAFYSSTGTYCSNACQQDYQFAVRYETWINGQEEKSSRWLRRALLVRDGATCSVCAYESWCGKPLTLELDHIDGNHENNAKNNLRLICPNCHSQTPTYKNRNMGYGRKDRRKSAAPH
jgi:5-methylcytosine-specific restriction endonuclease McrA